MTNLSMRVFLASSLVAAACSRAPATKPQSAAPPAQTSAPTKPPPGGSQLLDGLGQVHHPIHTSSPDAQKFFDQGMALVFGFNHEAAIRSFDRAAELDPTAAMPHWGRAWALGPNYNMDVDDAREKQAFEDIAQAKKLAADGPAAERDYVEAMAVRYSDNMRADRSALARKYGAAMGELARKYPDDLDAATLYAESLMNLNPWKLWSPDGKAAPGTDRIIAVLESVLNRNPNHLGANHYYIHAVEESPHPSRALTSAARLDTAAPLSGHLVHMPAHIYDRTGNHAAAARSNAGGAAADEKYLATVPDDSMYGLMYYSHNLMFLTHDEMMQGRFADAERPALLLAKRLESNPHATMFPMVESVIVLPVSVLLRFNRHDDVLALAAPPSEKPVRVAWQHFARGISLVRVGKIEEAAAERSALAEAVTMMPDAAKWGGDDVTARDAMKLAALVLDARLSWTKGERDKSIELWRNAVASQDRFPYDEPPAWFYPVRESLGAALLLAGKPLDAERVFREDLKRNPRNARSLFGLHEALGKQGKDSDAAWVQREFEEAWKDADTKLTIEGL
jgi:tetratricopeptide (TPR) repeat protein